MPFAWSVASVGRLNSAIRGRIGVLNFDPDGFQLDWLEYVKYRNHLHDFIEKNGYEFTWETGRIKTKRIAYKMMNH